MKEMGKKEEGSINWGVEKFNTEEEAEGAHITIKILDKASRNHFNESLNYTMYNILNITYVYKYLPTHVYVYKVLLLVLTMLYTRAIDYLTRHLC